MSKPTPTMKEMRAYKIGARARKFAMEDCEIEGYEVLMTAIEEARDTDPELYPLLLTELAKYERRLETIHEAEETADSSK